MINLNKIKTYSLKKRYSKVRLKDFAQPPLKGRSFSGFYKSLPDILRVKDLRAIVEAVVKAHKKKKPVIFMAGAHVIKCGLSPVVIELIKRKIITCVVLNGAGIIHDFEIAFQGKTSEDIEENLKNGRFGMGRETADFLNHAITEGGLKGMGLGEAVAYKIQHTHLPYKNLSIIYQAKRSQVPVCVAIAIGTDIIHQHPSFDAGLAAEGSLRDFYRLVEVVTGLGKGGVLLNVGSAVVLPEVFLKALNLARNLGFVVQDFTTANFDMLYHYRPAENVVRRPNLPRGRGYYLIGHHEIMLALFAQAVIEKI